jgi:hypothetical protein
VANCDKVVEHLANTVDATSGLKRAEHFTMANIKLDNRVPHVFGGSPDDWALLSPDMPGQ